MTQRNDFLTNLQISLEKICDFSSLELSYWGNDIPDNFMHNIGFLNYESSFTAVVDNELQEAFIFLILGQINYFNLEELKQQVEKLHSKNKKTIIIHAPGSSANGSFDLSYTAVKNLSDEIDIDYLYPVFPFDIKEIVEKVKELRDGIHEK